MLVSGLVGGLVVAVPVALLVLTAGVRLGPGAAPSSPPLGTPIPVAAGGQLAVPAAVGVYDRVAPSVVLVANQSVRATPLGRQTGIGFGTGLIFDARGYVVTNEHVIAGASKLSVTLADGATYPARFVGDDPSTDLAVLHIAAGRLPAAVFATGPVRPGETAIAIGNPLGPQLTQSITVGVVSAVRPMLYGLVSADPRVTSMIQTDVAINPGNSGGPLLNAAGQVIGITTIKVPMAQPGIAASGLGFAIPASTVRRVVEDLVRYGYVKRAWLGVRLTASPPETTPERPQTIRIADVTPGSPAALAGLRPGDTVRAWNGRPIANYYGLILAIDAASPGQAVDLTVRRDGRDLTRRVVLGVVPQREPPIPTVSGSAS